MSADAFEIPECRICHCTDELACADGCWWVEDPTGQGDLCSGCVQLAIALEQISVVLAAAGGALTVRELATRTGIAFLELAPGPDGLGLLDLLVDGGHLTCDHSRDLRRFALPIRSSVR